MPVGEHPLNGDIVNIKFQYCDVFQLCNLSQFRIQNADHQSIQIEALLIVKGTATDTKCGRQNANARCGQLWSDTVKIRHVFERGDPREISCSCDGDDHPHVCWTKFERSIDDACAVPRQKFKTESHPQEVETRSSCWFKHACDQNIKPPKHMLVVPHPDCQ